MPLTLKPRMHVLSTALLLTAAGTAVAGGAQPAKTPVATAPAAATASTGLRPAQPTSQQLDLAMRQYGDMRRMLALGGRCKWLVEAERAAIESSAAERLAWLRLWDGDLAKAEADAKTGIKGDDKVVCTDPASTGIKNAVTYGAWQMRNTWLMRGHALLDGPGRPAWFKDLSPVARHRATLQQTVDALQAKYAEALGPAQPTILKDAERMLAATCATSVPSCPARADDPRFNAYAKEWIALAERYAALLARTKDKVGEPPAELMKPRNPGTRPAS